jgi:tetratricopeptide (TPR) repeat protein
LLAAIALAQGEYEQAATLAQELLTITRQVGDKAQLFDALFTLGEAALRLDDEKEALACYQQGLALAQTFDEQQALGKALLGMAHFSLKQEQFQRAAYFFAAAEVRLDVATEMDPIERAEYARGVRDIRATG